MNGLLIHDIMKTKTIRVKSIEIGGIEETMGEKIQQTYKFTFTGSFRRKAIFPKELLHLAKESDKQALENVEFFEKGEVNLFIQNSAIYILRIRGEYIGLGTMLYPFWRKDISSKNIKEIGMHVAKKYRGKGYGRSIVQHLVSICIENGNLPIAECLTDNVASRKTLESVGFELKVW